MITRTRKKDTIRFIPFLSRTKTTGYGAGETLNQYSTPTDGTIQVMTDDVGPEYWQAQRHHSFCVRPVTHHKATIRSVARSYVREDWLKDGNGADIWRNNYSNTPVPSVFGFSYGNSWGVFRKLQGNLDPFEDVLLTTTSQSGSYWRALLLQEAFAAAAEPDYNWPVAAAEFSKTLQAADRLSSLLPRFGQWLSRNRKAVITPSGFFRATGTLAQQWLEYRFGFMQLYYDSKSLVKLLTRRNVLYRTHVRSRSFSNAGVVLDSEVAFSDVHKRHLHRFATRNDIYRAGLIVRAEPEHDITRALGWHQPFTALWELAPFSFVLDYFVNIADMWGALDGRLTLRPVASWTSHRMVYTTHNRISDTGTVVPYGDGMWGCDPCSVDLQGEEEYTYYSREAHPLPRLVVPPYRPNLDFRRFFDLAALLRGIRSR